MKPLRYLLIALMALGHATVYGHDNNAPNSRNSDIKGVRIFTGYTISKGGSLSTPSVVTIIETSEQLDCRFVAFVGVPLEFRDVVKITHEGKTNVFGGVENVSGKGDTEDPRNFIVKWTAELVGKKITGTFEQPYDKGDFVLHEAYSE